MALPGWSASAGSLYNAKDTARGKSADRRLKRDCTESFFSTAEILFSFAGMKFGLLSWQQLIILKPRYKFIG
jgi:hypothetical protein